MNSIVIKDLAVECIIGIHAWERSTPQNLYIDLEAFFDFSSVLESRSIKDTVDYVKVAQIVEKVAKEGKYKLLEPLAGDLAQALFAQFPLRRVEFRFKKPTPDVPHAQYVGISFAAENRHVLVRPGAGLAASSGPTLDGKVALITGSATGLGRAFAEHLGRRGCRIAVHYRNSENEARSLAETIGTAPGMAKIFQGELSSFTQMQDLVNQVVHEFQGIDILINNIGAYTSKHWDEIPIEEFAAIIQTNISGTFFLTREVLRHMRKKGFGRIINIGQTACDRIQAHTVETPYHISKTALSILTKTIAKAEGAHNITCNMLSPGVLINSTYFPKDLDQKIPLGRIAQFQDLLGTLDFLLSPEANYMTGANLEVTGGYGL